MMRIIDIFRRNALKKIIALIAAFLMWLFVMLEQDPEIEEAYTVPLTMSNVPYEFIAICETKTVTLDARASRSNFVKYDSNAFRVYANLEGLEEGEHEIIPRVIMPQGFTLINTKPNVIKVQLDPLIERQMPIELRTIGSIAPDAVITDMRKSMDTVTVVGPKSFVEQTDKVFGNLNLTGNSSSFEAQISMNAVDDKDRTVSRVRVVPSVITVSVDVSSGLKKRIVPIVPELSVTDGWELSRITVEPAQMEIIGAESALNSIITLKTEPFMVQTGQRNFKGTLKLVIPDGVSVKTDEVTVSAEVVRKTVIREQPEN